MARFIRRLFNQSAGATESTAADDPDSDDMAALIAGTVVAALRGK